MTRTAQWLYGWLLLLPAAALLALFTHYPRSPTLWHSFLSTPKGARPPVFVGLDNYRQLVDDPIFWQALSNNLWYALGTIPGVDRARAADGGLGQRQDRRARLPAPRVLHADGAADDRGGQHLALLLHAGVRPARADPRRHSALAAHNWLGSKNTALPLPDGRDRLEGSRLLHDLLPGGAAVDVAASRRSGGDRRRVALVFLPPRHVSAADADDAVRARQRGDQRVPPGRSRRRDDARRPRQRDLTAALLHLRDRLPLLGLRRTPRR